MWRIGCWMLESYPWCCAGIAFTLQQRRMMALKAALISNGLNMVHSMITLARSNARIDGIHASPHRISSVRMAKENEHISMQKARATIEASTGFFIVSTTVKLIIVNKYIPIGLCKITELLI